MDYSLSQSRAPDTACPQRKLARVLVFILPLAARRQGIARYTALHLDCARSARGGAYRFALETTALWLYGLLGLVEL